VKKPFLTGCHACLRKVLHAAGSFFYQDYFGAGFAGSIVRVFLAPAPMPPGESMTSLTDSPITLGAHLEHTKYRADIDGLRAIAVLSVVIFHAFPTLLKGGFIGVDIFFVISGFLISQILFSNLEKKKFSLIDFYSRRINRIYPALLTVLIFCLGFG
jgi:hypothetical protein